MENEKTNKKQQKIFRSLRVIVLLAILIVSTLIGLNHLYYSSVRPFGVDAFCPYGGIESALTLFTTGNLISRIQWNNFIMLIAIFLILLLFQRAFCGYICVLGFLQELFGRLGKSIFKKRFTINPKIDIYLRFFKYLVLIFSIYFSFYLTSLFIRPFDPWAAYNHLTSSELFVNFGIGAIILFISLIGSFFYDRFFCKYLCPLGAFISLFNRLSIFKIRRNESSCIKCHACNKACPVNINVESSDVLNDPECINCNECINVCPVKDTLNVTPPKKCCNASPLIVMIVVLVIFFGSIGLTTITGQFKWIQGSIHYGTENETKNEKININIENIKGNNTLSEAIIITKLPLELFVKEYNFRDEEMSLKLRVVMESRKLGVDDFKVFARDQYNQLP